MNYPQLPELHPAGLDAVQQAPGFFLGLADQPHAVGAVCQLQDFVCFFNEVESLHDSSPEQKKFK